MNVCRTCLIPEPKKNLSELNKENIDGSIDCVEIMLFCLNIKVNEEDKFTNSVCVSCFRKIVTFYEFKKIALNSDTYLRSLKTELPDTKVDLCLRENLIKNEECVDFENNDTSLVGEIEVKIEPEIKVEFSSDNANSDDDPLIVIKKEQDQINAPQTETTLSTKQKRNPKVRKKRNILKEVKPKQNESEVCDKCGKSFRNLKEHSKVHLPKTERKFFQCKVCEKQFRSHSARYRHEKSSHLGIKNKCDVCFKEVICLKRHKMIVHHANALQHPCTMCSQRFITRSKLEIHMRSHTKDRPYECDICQKKFIMKVTLLMHKRQVHDKERSHLCQFCSKTFFKKCSLLVHLRTHTKEKPYECTKCGKFYQSTQTLKNHLLTHSEDKKFECPVCDKKFLNQCYLRVHLISHTKEKRYPCQFCGVKFGRSDHRKRHEWTAHQKHTVPSP